ncbi:hypothetical protein D3870_07390 [Noviherbaspirillum cavernae]|uniref:C-type lysozyme inhibitor domain-containing protein n=2 Tax=Noviherbaspirillum cavernae TaxID=2320862 RepID=A0A418X637_9BURK|nr:hypothetical protein D3870_07390 [Noviherbaspirillum cavernae]
MKLLTALLFATIGMGVGLPALAQDSAAAAKQTHKPAAKKTVKKKTEPTPQADAAAGDHEEDKEPDVTSASATEFACELGNKVTIYRNADDDKHIALRWKKQLLRLKRVDTTTGAHRFENRRSGWVWIDIPAKSMLLDAKKGQQLANECRNPDQLKAKAEETIKS